MDIIIDIRKKHQTITGFGASGAWWSQYIGGWNETDTQSGIEKRERIAQLLFDRDKGIGLTQYRYNIGAGSQDSKKGKYLRESMRASNFEVSPGVYDWNRDANAVWFLYAAKKYGVDEITMFVNSPIERLTKNHKAYLDIPLKSNIKRNNYREFAKYTLDVVDHFVKEDLPIKYISPVNEPVWVWLEKQEGCHYRPHQVYSVMKTFAKMMDDYPALKCVKLSGAENGDLRWFNKSYTHIMQSAKIKDKVDSVDFHSYFLPVPKFLPKIIRKPMDDRLAYAKRYKKWMDRHYPEVALKMSEWCHMQPGTDCSIESGIEQAKVMAEDLQIMNVVSWQSWVALANYGYCDGLIYYDDEKRTFECTKRYYAFGNFSKFVRPGAVRIDAQNGADKVYTLAFEQKDNYVVVIVNYDSVDKNCNIKFDCNKKYAKMYVTSKDYSLDEFEIKDLNNFNVVAKSVTTVIINK